MSQRLLIKLVAVPLAAVCLYIAVTAATAPQTPPTPSNQAMQGFKLTPAQIQALRQASANGTLSAAAARAVVQSAGSGTASGVADGLSTPVYASWGNADAYGNCAYIYLYGESGGYF